MFSSLLGLIQYQVGENHPVYFSKLKSFPIIMIIFLHDQLHWAAQVNYVNTFLSILQTPPNHKTFLVSFFINAFKVTVLFALYKNNWPMADKHVTDRHLEHSNCIHIHQTPCVLYFWGTATWVASYYWLHLLSKYVYNAFIDHTVSTD